MYALYRPWTFESRSHFRPLIGLHIGYVAYLKKKSQSPILPLFRFVTSGKLLTFLNFLKWGEYITHGMRVLEIQ